LANIDSDRGPSHVEADSLGTEADRPDARLLCRKGDDSAIANAVMEVMAEAIGRLTTIRTEER
jgi:hypothetical protein